MNDFEELTKKISYEFKDDELLKSAFVHSSYLNESGGKGLHSNERLEFLGDAVLSATMSELLYKKFPDTNEGELTRLRARLVNTQVLAEIAKKLELGDQLLLGRGERLGGGSENDSILADTFEALLAAIFLDCGPEFGYNIVLELIELLFAELIESATEEPGHFDYKPALQELSRIRFSEEPRYSLLKEEGPAHKKIFEVTVSVGGRTLGKGTALRIKDAEQLAAKEALGNLKQSEEKPV
ncbi:MAG: ribonuclease III [Thermodesulfobacteriota bacterium]